MKTKYDTEKLIGLKEADARHLVEGDGYEASGFLMSIQYKEKRIQLLVEDDVVTKARQG